MLRKLIKITKSETCSCAEGKKCNGCKHKKIIKPQVYIEEPRRLTVPIVVSRLGHRPNTTVQIAKRPETSGPRATLCQWYRRRKALKELKEYQKREQQIEYERLKRAREAEIIKLYQENQIRKAKLDREKEKQEYELQKAQRQREAEVYELYRKQAEAAAAATPVTEITKPQKIKVKKAPVVKPKTIKEKKHKEKIIWTKPKAESRYASAKIKSRSVINSLSNRFVNCCYKCCCQLYCWMTIILVIGVFMILYF